MRGMLWFYFSAVSERARAVFTAGLCLWGKSCSGWRKEHKSLGMIGSSCSGMCCQSWIREIILGPGLQCLCSVLAAGAGFPLSGTQGKSEMWCYFHYTALYFLLLVYISEFAIYQYFISIYLYMTDHLFANLYFYFLCFYSEFPYCWVHSPPLCGPTLEVVVPHNLPQVIDLHSITPDYPLP